MRRQVLGHNCEWKERGKCGLQLATRGQNSPFKVQQLSGGLEFGRDDDLLWYSNVVAVLLRICLMTIELELELERGLS